MEFVSNLPLTTQPEMGEVKQSWLCDWVRASTVCSWEWYSSFMSVLLLVPWNSWPLKSWKHRLLRSYIKSSVDISLENSSPEDTQCNNNHVQVITVFPFPPKGWLTHRIVDFLQNNDRNIWTWLVVLDCCYYIYLYTLCTYLLLVY